MSENLEPVDPDMVVDAQIAGCLDPRAPKSFFLFAGAGSGKTRALVTALQVIRQHHGEYFRINRQKVAVITFTNAATDEIKHRLDYDPLFAVSTIHSFIWDLIRPYQNDIREWLRADLIERISELREKQSKGRPGQANANRHAEILHKTERLAQLNEIRRFVYSPTSDNTTRDSLSHSEVIYMGAFFLIHRPLMQRILTKRFPVLFIDESQDTKKELVDAVFAVQSNFRGTFILGVFGDMMQRIYADGKPDLGENLPTDWIKPEKKINYRCPIRVIKLINQIRSATDGRMQEPKKNQAQGQVRLFVVKRSNAAKAKIERQIGGMMAKITGDPIWSEEGSGVKKLILEHHMAARRLGFLNLFEALSADESLRTGLLDGSLGGIRFFTEMIYPLREAHINNDQFEIARIVKLFSPILAKENIKGATEKMSLLKVAGRAVESLIGLWQTQCPTLREIVENVKESKLFRLPPNLAAIAYRSITASEAPAIEPGSEETDEEVTSSTIGAWEIALKCSFDEIGPYKEYISGQSPFATHQGVKGLQFPRVMVIMDDEEARGFMFKYDKLFGVAPLGDADRQNMREGKETGVDRTRRLFYVSCSRAEESLAIVAYTGDPGLLVKNVVEQKWFDKEEIHLVS